MNQEHYTDINARTIDSWVESGWDWGKRYIDVDLTEQYARFYDENGVCFWETVIISRLCR